MMLSECTDEHFSLEQTRYLFHIISEIYDDGIKVTASEVKKRSHEGAEEWIQQAVILGAKITNVEMNMNELVKTKNRNSINKMVEALIVISSHPDYDPQEAEEMINLYLPEKHSLIGNKAMVEIAVAVEEAEKALDERMKNPNVMTGVPLSYKGTNGAQQGFPSLDELLYGLRGGDLIMFAAKSGHGKTAFAMNLTRVMAYHNSKKVYYLNTEMELTQMVNRWASMATMIPYSSIERGDITATQREEFGKWADKFSEAPLLVSQIAELSMETVVALTKGATRKYGQFDCIIVDYIWRMEVKETNGMQEYQIKSYLAKRLKTFAQQFNIPVIALAQLNDEGKLEGAKKMRNECDGLFFIEPKVEDGVPSETDYFIVHEKVRRGKAGGKTLLDFDKKYMFIREM
jgi:replicative DNA helicase